MLDVPDPATVNLTGEPMSAMRFRTATEQDAGGILALMREYYTEDGYPWSEAQQRAALLGLIRDAGFGRVWVLEADGIAGYLSVTLGYSLLYGGQDAFLDEIYLAGEVRGRGLGREAIRLAVSYARERGARAIHLEVEPHREAARRLYGEAGFVDHGRRLMSKLLGGGATAAAGAESER